MKKGWDWCLFYGDMFTFCHEFNDLTSRSKIFKIIDVIRIFIRIIDYWLSVNIKVVNDYFDLLPTHCHSCKQNGFYSFEKREDEYARRNFSKKRSWFWHSLLRNKIWGLHSDCSASLAVKLSNYFRRLVRLWPSNHPTSPLTPNVSSTDDISDSGVDCQ